MKNVEKMNDSISIKQLANLVQNKLQSRAQMTGDKTFEKAAKAAHNIIIHYGLSNTN